ncbi:tubulin-like doman-containing protein [Tychonema sp. BBK16]|uniref:tubulin-like doman-containing protein n=1 Tax=Tychonema sp. BBK16 TaxID=2699888 RepID=UPI001F44BDBC|nr:tubulin-like doman-containing protein [Tychonema sp. BBK16]MCF6372056.1 zinc-ribbon domain-containing protein [Tychonema sp. BBK16]
MATVDEKSMVPTILIGVGGTGNEVLARVRRLVEETYGGLKNFPIISFLVIDTDKEYKLNNPGAGGTPFKDNEKYFAKVSGNEVENIMSNMGNFPWIEAWFPNELERNMTALEAGAGQIRACGRFAFFCNYHKIKQSFNAACDRVKGHDTFMLDKYNVKVNNNSINVFITGSISGGTGSGMLIDIGYAVRKWLQGQSSSTTAIVPMPNAFAGINVGDRVVANGYAALMELSYFSDYRTEYAVQFSAGLIDEIRDKRPAFDFTYLVGTKNGETEFPLDQIREMIGQNIFLDLTSDFAPHKRSIRDNIKGSWAAQDPGGRGYSKQFMSFGLSTIEIPIAQIRTSLSNRLAADFVTWWLNESVQLVPNLLEVVQSDLKRIRLTEMEMLTDLSAAGDKSYLAELSNWVNSIRNEINADKKMQCTQQGFLGIFGSEKGKILEFVNYLQKKVEEYRSDHLREMSPDERLHGDYLQKMYDNRNRIIKEGRKTLEAEFYTILEDRNKGPKFADAFIATVRQIFENAVEKFRREGEKVWEPNEARFQQQYQKGLEDIRHFQEQFGLSKQDAMEKYCVTALSGLEGSLIAIIQRKSRSLGLEVIVRLQDHLTELETRLARLNQKLRQNRDEFQRAADQQASSADVLVINGIKLFDRQQLNDLYRDAIEQLAGASEGAKSKYELGIDGTCSNLSSQVLAEASPMWKQNREADEVMRLFDLPQLQDVQDPDFKEIIDQKTQLVIKNTPNNSRLKRDLAACDGLFKMFKNDEGDIRSQLKIAYDKSKPLILLSRPIMSGRDAGFTEALNTKAALVGGRNATEAAAIKLIPLIKERVGSSDAITPLGEDERHRIVFVQEVGGFSLRCIEGMRELRQSYQDWKGQSIQAKRAIARGENKDLPIPVHIQKEAPFWDVFPEDPKILQLIVQARALGVVRREENRSTKEKVIRYTIKSVTGQENVDLASSWEETLQLLEVVACRPDKEEIEKQVKAILTAAETVPQKQQLYSQLMGYLDMRETELEKEGGNESPVYKRELKIIQEVIVGYKFYPPESGSSNIQTPPPVNPVTPSQPQPNGMAVRSELDKIYTDDTVINAPGGISTPPVQPPIQPVQDFVFCTNCGHKNPSNSKFCAKCGTGLTKVG